ncbi:MAG: hypothetical protein JW954_06975 [Dehalococcoidaceae bacterium]|nr:hypothetical protein [Dehalococcoidaceae bacterium]
MRIKKETSEVIEGHVAKLLVRNRKYTAKELKDKVEHELGGRYSFTERTYLNIKNKLLKDFSEDPIDAPWSVGACLKFDIPGEIVPLLLEVKRNIPLEEIFTIRTAQWVAKLHNLIPDRKDLSHLYYISTYYGLYEQICEMANIPFNTTKPDSMLPDSEKVKEAFIELLLKEEDDDERASTETG